ncbi:MAG: hypothetical protein ACRC1F_00350 [Metamycoplasmataceae bacterium]
MKLNCKKIVDKKFETVINGYSPTQVDIFFDKICEDYIEYDEKIAKFESEIEALKKENMELKGKLSAKEDELNSKNEKTNPSETQDINIKINKTNKVDNNK